MSFSTDDVAVTLKGAQWFALLARIKFLQDAAGNPQLEPCFSRKGKKVYMTGIAALQEQILAASIARPERKGSDAAP